MGVPSPPPPHPRPSLRLPPPPRGDGSFPFSPSPCPFCRSRLSGRSLRLPPGRSKDGHLPVWRVPYETVGWSCTVASRSTGRERGKAPGRIRTAMGRTVSLLWENTWREILGCERMPTRNVRKVEGVSGIPNAPLVRGREGGHWKTGEGGGPHAISKHVPVRAMPRKSKFYPSILDPPRTNRPSPVEDRSPCAAVLRPTTAAGRTSSTAPVPFSKDSHTNSLTYPSLLPVPAEGRVSDEHDIHSSSIHRRPQFHPRSRTCTFRRAFVAPPPHARAPSEPKE